jgi:bifunctional ADP-heptose synthase (sugar kinase/adenylyltransferase)
MLTGLDVDRILARIPALTMGVLGDLFLDRYLDIDAALSEPSIETGLDAYQVVRVRSYPGAAGTVINNLAALGVKQIYAISIIGDDGEGYELLQGLAKQERVNTDWVLRMRGNHEFRTPTYIKPMLHQPGRPTRELNRLDIKNHTPPRAPLDEKILNALDETWSSLDALLVLDQVSHADCGTVTTRVRNRLAELGAANPDKVILADSRERIGHFRSVWLKPNQAECVGAVQEKGTVALRIEGQEKGTVALRIEGQSPFPEPLEDCVAELARRAGRPVFCTCGDKGILLFDPRLEPPQTMAIPAYPVTGPIDIVGAGDSTSAGIACALAAGATLPEAAAFGNLVASVTIQQLGTTGTATPVQLRQRWREAIEQKKGSG